MKIKIYFSIIIITSLLSSCISDLKGNLGLDDYPKQLVVNCFMTNDSTIRVKVEHTFNVVGEPEFEEINYANVQISDIEGNIYECNYHESGFYISDFIPELNKTYDLIVEVENYEQVKSSDIMPKTEIEIESWKLTDSVDITTDGEYYSDLEIIVKDIVDENNFYELSIFQIDSLNEIIPVRFGTSNTIIENPAIDAGPATFSNAYYNILFSDNLFKNQNAGFNFHFRKPFPEKSVYLCLKNCSEAYFQYQLDYCFYKNSSENPFYEPLNAFSNIKNGFGIFACYTADIETIN